MKLFKNKVGRPSNEEIKKRKIVYTSLISFIVLLVGVGAFFAGKYINKILGSANQRECVMPYTKAKCYNKTNDTVKKIQEMLKRLGYYNGSLNGTFDNNTYNAVKKFQKSQGIEQDGNVGPDTLKRLARKTNVKYYIIKFDKNGGSGTLDSSYKNELVVINGILTRLPSVKLTKKGYTHVGYFASTSKLAKNKNNLFGMKSGKKYAKYSSKSESVKAFGRLISGKTYFGKGRTSLSAIGRVYCDSNWSSYVVRNMNNLYKASK